MRHGRLMSVRSTTTPTDINFVDVIDGVGVFVGRAYLTLLVDVYTRCIVGFC